MEKIKQSYFNLLMIASSIRQYWISKVGVESFINMIETAEDLFEDLSTVEVKQQFEIQTYAIKGFIIIQTCAFLDEYGLLFRLMPENVDFSEEAKLFKKDLKSVMKPAITLINNYWKDLYAVRNNLLAHNWRKDGQAIMFSQLTDSPTNAPWIDEEFTLLIGIFDSIINSLKEFKPAFFSEMNNKIVCKEKVHHRAPVIDHEKSLEIANALRTVMQHELNQLNIRDSQSKNNAQE